MAILFQKCEKIWSHIAHPKMSRTHAHPAHFSYLFRIDFARTRTYISYSLPSSGRRCLRMTTLSGEREEVAFNSVHRLVCLLIDQHLEVL